MQKLLTAILIAGGAILAYWNKPAKLIQSVAAQICFGLATVPGAHSSTAMDKAARFLTAFGLSGLALVLRKLTADVQPDLSANLVLASAAIVVGCGIYFIESGKSGQSVGARVRNAASESPVFRLAKSELRIMRYALVPPAADRRQSDGALKFWMSNDATQLAWAFVVVALIESVALHLLVAGLGQLWLWVAVVLADVTIVYAIGIVRSLSRFPVTIDRSGAVHIQVGLLFDCRTLASNIELLDSVNLSRSKTALNGALLSSPNVHLRLKVPAKVRILGLFNREVTTVRMKLADGDQFTGAVLRFR